MDQIIQSASIIQLVKEEQPAKHAPEKEKTFIEEKPSHYECVICFGEYKSESDVVFLCKASRSHYLCRTCHDNWKENCCRLIKEVSCPICRNTLIKNGVYTYYYPDGVKRQEVFYKDDVPEGLVQLWQPNGLIQQRFHTKNNKYHGLFEDYDIHGCLKQRIEYEDGVFHGLFEEYYPNEFIKVRCYYKRGSIVGTYQLFYKTSLLFLECQCGPIGGKINGLLQVWNEEGELIEKYQCKNGRINIVFDDELNVSYSRKSGNFEKIE